MPSDFDPNVFMGTKQTETGDTHYTTIPPGDYVAVIGSDEKDIDVNSGTTDRGRWVQLYLNWYIDDPDLAAKLNLRQLRVRQSIFLDVEGDPPHLVWGTNRNVKLAKVREAVGQNTGAEWNVEMLRGAGPALVNVSEDPSRDDPEVKYNNVIRVVAA